VHWIGRVITCEDTSILETCIFVTNIAVSGVCCLSCHGFEMTGFVLCYEGKWRTGVTNSTRRAAIFQGKRHKVTLRDALKCLSELS